MTLGLSINNPRFDGNGITWAIAASVLLHVLVAVIIPNFNFPSLKETPQVMKVELQQAMPPAPAPVVEPLPPIDIPEPPKPKPKPIKKKPKPIIKPKPIERIAPTPIEQPEVTSPPSEKEVIAVQPSANKTPTVVTPPLPMKPPPPPEPNQADVNNALSAYGNLLGRAIAKHKSYPKIAARRGWQGTAVLDLKIDSDGNVLSAIVRDSSGYDALDKRALAMVKKASPFPAPPKALQGRTLNISVPVTFKLNNG